MFKLGLDLGYGYIKGINDLEQTVKMPSILSLNINNDSLDINEVFKNNNLSKISDNLQISISNSKETKNFYVGESAKEKSNASYLLDDNKINSLETKVLLAATSVLLFPEDNVPVYLITGLPISQFKNQKSLLKEMLSNYKYIVSIPNYNITKTIKFENIDIFPQGIGAVYHSIWKDINKYTIPNTYIGLIDWGYKTIDYVVFYIDSHGKPKPVMDYSDSVNNGMYQIGNDVNKVFRNKTGNTLEIGVLNDLVKTGKIWYNGDWININSELLEIKKDRADKVKHSIKAKWADIMPRISHLFISGGGGIAMYKYLNDFTSHTQLIKNAQMANAKGFKLIGEIKEKSL